MFGPAMTVLAAILALTAVASADPKATPATFTVYDNMFFRGKPDTSGSGLVASNIVYENRIWPHGVGEGTLPDHGAFDELVRAQSRKPGPLVLDIERLPVTKGPPEIARRNMQLLVTLAEWARVAAPGKIIGFYGSNTLTKVTPADRPFAEELARHIDAMFPPMYTFDDDRQAWAKRAADEVAEARELAPGRPVFVYVWPQYHDGAPRQFAFIDAAYWTFQLQTLRPLADGIVIWGSGKFDWDDTTGWWSATRTFMQGMD